MRYVDATPQWSGLVHALAYLVTEGTTDRARTMAREELARMAALADAYAEAWKAGDEAMRAYLSQAEKVAASGGTRRPDVIIEED
jgi:hypothetical protein